MASRRVRIDDIPVIEERRYSAWAAHHGPLSLSSLSRNRDYDAPAAAVPPTTVLTSAELSSYPALEAGGSYTVCLGIFRL